MNETVIKFLKERPALSLNQLEKDAGLPQSLLSKVLKQKRVLNENHLKKLVPVLKKYGLTTDEEQNK